VAYARATANGGRTHREPPLLSQFSSIRGAAAGVTGNRVCGRKGAHAGGGAGGAAAGKTVLDRIMDRIMERDLPPSRRAVLDGLRAVAGYLRENHPCHKDMSPTNDG